MTHPLIEATGRAERVLVEGLGLTPMPLPPELASADGTWKNQPARIDARAYAGPGIRYVRVVFMEGADLAIGNVLALPDPRLWCPVLGADVVSLGTRHGCMIAADLSALGGDEVRAAEEKAIGAAITSARGGRPAPTLTPGGTLPAWCSEFFSPHALYTRPAGDEVAASIAEFLHYPRALVRLARSAHADEADAAQRIARWESYAAAHRTDDKGLQLLARAFGLEWAEQFVANVLFPSAGAMT